MKKKKYHTAGTFPKSNVKIDERGKIDTLTHTKMTVHFPGLVHALQKKEAKPNWFYGPKPPILLK
jgi:hypothetical protein